MSRLLINLDSDEPIDDQIADLTDRGIEVLAVDDDRGTVVAEL